MQTADPDVTAHYEPPLLNPHAVFVFLDFDSAPYVMGLRTVLFTDYIIPDIFIHKYLDTKNY